MEMQESPAGRWRQCRRTAATSRDFSRQVCWRLPEGRTQTRINIGERRSVVRQEVRDSTARLTIGPAPHFAAALRTSVFTSQVGKLRDVADPLMIEIVHFYSDLGTLQQIFESVNDLGGEYNRAHIPSGAAKDLIRSQLISGLTVLLEQISGYRNRLVTLRAKLPPAEPPKKRHAAIIHKFAKWFGKSAN